MVKNLPANAGDKGDTDLTLESGRSPGGGNGNPLQYSCLENPRDRGLWWATAHGVAKRHNWAAKQQQPCRRKMQKTLKGYSDHPGQMRYPRQNKLPWCLLTTKNLKTYKEIFSHESEWVTQRTGDYPKNLSITPVKFSFEANFTLAIRSGKKQHGRSTFAMMF